MTDLINHILKNTVRNLRHGAPMGKGFGSPQVGERCHVQQVELDAGGYDPSAAYWGHRAVGQKLYCAFSCRQGEHLAGARWQKYIDASDRKTALATYADVYGVVPHKWTP